MRRNDFILSLHTKKIKKTKLNKKDIDAIIREFDFKKVHKVMVDLGWEWRGQIPSITVLKQTARECIKAVNDDEEVEYCMTGGIKAYKDRDENMYGIGLDFILETYTRWEEE